MISHSKYAKKFIKKLQVYGWGLKKDLISYVVYDYYTSRDENLHYFLEDINDFINVKR